MYCVVIVRFPNGTKRTLYMVSTTVASYVDDRLKMGGVKTIAIRPISQAEYVRRTTAE